MVVGVRLLSDAPPHFLVHHRPLFDQRKVTISVDETVFFEELV